MRFRRGSSSGRKPADVLSGDGRRRAGRPPAVELYWLPLGAGGHCVRLNGRAYEAAAAFIARRPRMDLYHSALVITVPDGRFVVEQAPVRDREGARRGVVAEGAVGAAWARRLRLFRYEVRCWHDGVIPDIDEAVGSPQLVSDDPAAAQRLLDLVPRVPTHVWGRSHEGGEMWNSNSIIAWLVASSGLDADRIHPPPNGRAPGWGTGLAAARDPQALPRP